MSALKALFLLDPEIVFLNHGSFGACPRPVFETYQTWQRHYERTVDEALEAGGGAKRRVRFKANRELPPAAGSIESPYDADARYRHKRDTSWTGSMVHVSETCEPTAPHLLTHVHTTAATVHEAQCTTPIQQGPHRQGAASAGALR